MSRPLRVHDSVYPLGHRLHGVKIQFNNNEGAGEITVEKCSVVDTAESSNSGWWRDLLTPETRERLEAL